MFVELLVSQKSSPLIFPLLKEVNKIKTIQKPFKNSSASKSITFQLISTKSE